MNIDRIACDVGTENGTNGVSGTRVPNLNCLIPASRNNKIFILRNVLGTENSVRMTWLAILPSSELPDQLACLLVINVDHTVFACGDEVVTIGLVVAAE